MIQLLIKCEEKRLALEQSFKKDRQGSGKPMAGGSDAHKAAVKKYVSGMKSNRPGNTLPRQMKDPKKDAMVSKGGKVKVIDKSKEDDHLKKGYVRAEHMISKELYMREAKTIMVTHPKTPNKSMEISVDQWPAFKMRGYHHAEQKESVTLENRMRTMNLINKMKKASPAAKAALNAPSRVKSPNVTYDKNGKVVKEADDEFKPHMMYDPKTGEGKMAKVMADHLKMKKMGWGHDKPTK